MAELYGRVLYLGSLEPKVNAKIMILPRRGGGYYAATQFEPINAQTGTEPTLKTFGLNDRNRFSTRESLEEALRSQWGFEAIEGEE